MFICGETEQKLDTVNYRTINHAHPAERWLVADSLHVNNVLLSCTKHCLPFWQGAWTDNESYLHCALNFWFYLLRIQRGSWAFTVFVEMKNSRVLCHVWGLLQGLHWLLSQLVKLGIFIHYPGPNRHMLFEKLLPVWDHHKFSTF